MMVFNDVNGLYQHLKRENCIDYIKSLWNDLGKKTGENLSDRELTCYKENLTKGISLFVLKMPSPKYQKEAYFIGIVFEISNGFLKKEITNVCFFYLEFHNDNSNFSPIYIVNEILPGKTSQKFDFTNHGSIVKNDILSFRQAMYDLITQKKTYGLWAINSQKLDGSDDVLPLSDSTVQRQIEDDLIKLWDKWTNYPVDDMVQDECTEAINSILEALAILIQRSIDEGLYPDEMAEKLGEINGAALGKMSRGSFMIGLEYPDFDPLLTTNHDEIPYKLLVCASDDTKKLITMYICQLIDRQAIPHEKGMKMAEMAGEFLLDGMIGCFEIGAKYSPQNKLFNDLSNIETGAEQITLEVYPSENKVNSCISGLVNDLRDERRRNVASSTLIAMGNQVAPFIRPLLRDMNPDVRKSALSILTELEKRNHLDL